MTYVCLRTIQSRNSHYRVHLLFSEKMNQTYITVFFFSLNFLFGATSEDRCSKHSRPNYYNLTECPSSEKFNLLECYYEDLKNSGIASRLTNFWCWSRKDNDEKTIKNISISGGRVKDKYLIAKINQPFSTQFTFNGTHLKCDTMEKWANESIHVNIFSSDAVLPCVTSTISVARFVYNQYDLL